MDRLLVLCRHGQSDWNLKNLFTGWKDPDLTEKGVGEAKAAGQRLKAKGVGFDIAFTSDLTRAQHTCRLILGELGQPGLETIRDLALNERDYGELLASTRTMPVRNGARSRCMSGAAPTMCPRRAARA